MTNPLPFLLRLLLATCLAVYGSFGVANASGDSSGFYVEICANGVAETLLVGSDGQPIETSKSCPECLRCCSFAGSDPVAPAGDLRAFDYSPINAERPVFQTRVFQKRNIHPVPRGPPAVRVLLRMQSNLILCDQVANGQEMRSGGRPPFKDAYT